MVAADLAHSCMRVGVHGGEVNAGGWKARSARTEHCGALTVGSGVLETVLAGFSTSLAASSATASSATGASSATASTAADSSAAADLAADSAVVAASFTTT